MLLSKLAQTAIEKLVVASFFLVGASATFPLQALGSPFQSQGPFVIPEAGSGIPTPRQVPGKEFSDRPDRDAFGNLDPLQVIAWDGAGGTANTFDYNGGSSSNQEVDALANVTDDLFLEAVNDSAALLFSVEQNANIYYETIKVPVAGVWANATVDIDDTNPINDLDALEVWGLDGPGFDDSDRFSLLGDPAVTGFGRAAVFAYDSDNDVATPYISVTELAAVINVPESLFDLDSLMTLDLNADATFDNGDWVMFSTLPIDLNGDGNITEDVNGVDIDGGEIYVYQKGKGVSFLFHGGHLWDTAFDVSGTYNLNNENVDALEAVSTSVSEPSNLKSLSLLCGLGLLLKRKSRNNRRF